jgi:ribose transport system substrate-binding protein
MKFRSTHAVSSLALLALVLAGCQESYHDKEERFVLIAANINLPYWQEADAGLRDVVKEMGLGVKAEMDGPASYSPKEEVDAFEKAVASHPAGILVSVANPELFQAPIAAAIASGIPVICLDSDAPDSKRVMFIGTDNFRAGQESAKRIAEILKGHGDIVLVTIPGQLNLEERVRGVNEALKKYPGIKIAQTLDDKGDSNKAFDAVNAVISAKKTKVDGILCLEASGGAGAASALHRVNLDGKVPVVSFDKDPETLEWVERGGINATVVQKPYVMAYYGVKFLDDLHHNAVHDFKDWHTAPAPPLPAWVDTGTAIVDKGNLAAFREALAAHPKPL